MEGGRLLWSEEGDYSDQLVFQLLPPEEFSPEGEIPGKHPSSSCVYEAWLCSSRARWPLAPNFCHGITCWAPWILQFQTTGLPPIFLRTQPCEGKYAQWQYAVSIPEEEVILSFLFLSSCRSYTSSFSSIMRFNCCGLSWTSANLPTKSCCRYLRNWTRQTGAIKSKLSACLHGGGGTHVGEVTHSSV